MHELLCFSRMAIRKTKTAPVRLADIFARDQDAWTKYSINDLAAKLGVSRQRVQKLLPGYGTGRLQRLLCWKLDRFVRKHPEATRTPARGGLTLSEVARRLDTTTKSLRIAWQSLELPHRAAQKLSPTERYRRGYERRRKRHAELTRLWRERHPERAREISRAAQRRYQKRVLREEQCIGCGKRFAWTQAHEERRRKGSRVVCSQRCGIDAERRERQATEFRSRKHDSSRRKHHRPTGQSRVSAKTRRGEA